MHNNTTIEKIKQYVKEKMTGEATGHDWFHVERVYKMAILISKSEKNVDLFVIKAAALLHDIGDWKTNNTGKSEEEILDKVCKEVGLPQKDVKLLKSIILNMSFSKNVGKKQKLSIEGKIVQDADRLEALGAIGIARAFAYGGKKNREIYNPNIKPQVFSTTAEYRASSGHTINHFYEKLFKIKAQLNTKTAKRIATKREKFMKDFLKQFYSEWQVRM